MVELYLHYLIRLQGIVLNELNRGTTLPFLHYVFYMPWPYHVHIIYVSESTLISDIRFLSYNSNHHEFFSINHFRLLTSFFTVLFSVHVVIVTAIFF
jgi:hypothetical protein